MKFFENTVSDARASDRVIFVRIQIPSRDLRKEVLYMDENNVKKGGISVETAHIFPIIKKWLYSEKDIFLREIVSNATDAVTKLRRLSSLGEYDGADETYSVRVTLDKEEKTITVSDNGIGMTEEELEKYICSIALSGALDFIQKYDENNQSNGIIGHFGLGFYSSFMVSDTVEVVTRSYTGDKALRWTCNGAGEYEIEDGERTVHGTDVIMHISEEEEAYLEEGKLREILEKYCSFMPVEIYFDDGEAKAEDFPLLMHVDALINEGKTVDVPWKAFESETY